MSKPQDKLNRPEQPGQIKTMFAMEGNPTVTVVIEQPGRPTCDERMWFPDASHAFAWCRDHRVNFVYNPAAPNN